MLGDEPSLAVKRLFAFLMRLQGFASFLVEKEFELTLMDHNADGLWKSILDEVHRESRVSILIPGYTGYAQKTLVRFIDRSIKEEKDALLPLLDNVLTKFCRRSATYLDFSELMERLKEVGYTKREILNMKLRKSSPEMQREKIPLGVNTINETKWNVFIAYDDVTGFDLAKHLKEALEKVNISSFVAKEDLPSYTKKAEKWRETIDKVINTCNSFILILSTEKLSVEVRREAELALNRNKTDANFSVIVFHLNDVSRTSEQLFSAGIDFKDYQQVDFEDKYELARKARSLLGDRGFPKATKVGGKKIGGSRPIPFLHYEITQMQSNGIKRSLPNVGFNIANLSDCQVRIRVFAEILLDGNSLGYPSGLSGHYNGKRIWNLNPKGTTGSGIRDGNFTIPLDSIQKDQKLMIKVSIDVIDERFSSPLPVGWVYDSKMNDWYYEPAA